MLHLKFHYPIGIDIGNQYIYAAQLKEVRQGFAVRGLVHREIEWKDAKIPGLSDLLVPLLRSISKDKRFFGKRVIVNISSQNIFSFPIRFQVGATETLEEAILRQSEQYLSFPLEEAIIDYPSILSLASVESDSYSATIIAVQRDYINQYLLMLKQAGLTVEAVDFGVSSLIRLHTYLYNITDNPMILCNIGHTQSMLSILTKESILAHQNVSWGIEILLGKISANLELFNEKDKAKILLKRHGLLYQDRESYGNGMDLTEDNITTDNIRRAIYQIITPYIEELIHELHKVIGYVRSEAPNTVFEGIYMYGLANYIDNLDGYLEKRLNIPTKVINPMQNMPLSDASILPDISDGAPFALALGLAMRKVTWL
jgi:type IV pilus assembly protein PilM